MPQHSVTQPPALGVLPAPLAASVRDAIAASRTPRTLRLYAGAFRRWSAWAQGNGFAALPGAPELVAGYIAHLGTNRSVATARQAAAAIAHAHRTAGHSNPCESEGVRRTLAGIGRQHAAAGKTVRQAAAITGERLAAIRATIRTELRGASPSTRKRAARDTALLAVMRDGLLRRSEAAAISWADLETAPDGSGRLTIRRSKTDQTGAGAVLYLGPPTVRALESIRPADPDPEDRVFALSGSQITRIIAARAAAAGIPGASGHSLRVGTAQDLAAKGAGLPELQAAGRWSDPGMPARYIRKQTAGRGPVARYLYR